jgi:hypothetical protein
MPNKETKRIGSFQAQGGSMDIYTIHEYQTFVISRTRDGVERTPAQRYFKTAEKKSVNPINPEESNPTEFEIVEGNIFVRRI